MALPITRPGPSLRWDAAPQMIVGTGTFPGRSARKGALDVAATESDPIALQRFELMPEPVPSEVLGASPSMGVWALRLSGGSVREVLAGEPTSVQTREYVFGLPLDVMANLARTLTQACEQERGVL